MGYRSSDQISPRIYPWWLILVGFVFGVIVTLVVTASRPPQTTVIYQPADDQPIWLLATRFAHEATMNAQVIDSGIQRPTFDDPLLQTVTAMVIEATRQAAQQAPPP